MIVNINKTPVLVILALIATSADGASDPVVEISGGAIAGYVLQSKNNSDFYAFKQIPFAAPPVGDLRFAEPVDPEPWNGVLNATQNTKKCFQGIQFRSLGQEREEDVRQSEDCLYLNVFTPVQPGTSEHLLPVLFWIHGGAFATGSIDNLGPEWLIDYEVVIVTVQYRLGPFGFASTMDGVIPGNLGLKDQRQALRWVKSNIKSFGGDPKRVTIAGESAGAISVSFLLLDPNSAGLFSAAIQESGSAIIHNSYITNATNQVFELAKILNKDFKSTNSSEALKLLRKVSAEDIMAASFKIPDGVLTGFIKSMNFGPVIEAENNRGNTQLVTTPMYKSFLEGTFSQIPILLGINSEESLLWIDHSGNVTNIAVDFDANYSRLIDYRLNVAPGDLETMGKQLKQIYTNSTFVEDFGAFVRYTSDAVFTNAILKQAECSTKFVPTYLYQFSYAGTLGAVTHGRVNIPGAETVGHGEDLNYLWNYGLLEQTPIPDADLSVSSKMLKMWTNFIKYQNPTPEDDGSLDNILWPQTTSSDLKYLNINSTLEVHNHPRYYAKVNALQQKYMRPPLTVM